MTDQTSSGGGADDRDGPFDREGGGGRDPRGAAGPFFDGLAKLIAGGAGAAEGVRREAETVIHSQFQRFAADMDLVPREEFEAVKEMAVRALDEVEALRAEIAAMRGGGSPQSLDD